MILNTSLKFTITRLCHFSNYEQAILITMCATHGYQFYHQKIQRAKVHPLNLDTAWAAIDDSQCTAPRHAKEISDITPLIFMMRILPWWDMSVYIEIYHLLLLSNHKQPLWRLQRWRSLVTLRCTQAAPMGIWLLAYNAGNRQLQSPNLCW